MEHLAGPQRRDDVRLRLPSTDARPFGECGAQVGALGVVRAGHLLEIGETRPILDVQHGPRGDVPCNEIRATRKLIVLVWLVEPDAKSQAAKARGLKLSHRGVHRVAAQVRSSVASPRVRNCEVKSHPERRDHTNDCLG
jgi:hypothetical protein